MALNLANTIAQFLADNPEKKFTCRQLADWVFQTYPSECAEKKERSNTINTDDELVQQLVREMSSLKHFFSRLQKKNPQIKMTDGRPRQYYFTQKSDSDEVSAAEHSRIELPVTDETTKPMSEHDLYPRLTEFLWSEFGLYSKRVDEKRSSNSQGPRGNHWLYPDIVSMENLADEWSDEVKNCVKEYSDKWTRLWSFEVKLLINRSNVRECFFQTVSNSSWANFSYLVAAEIEGADTLKELRMLNALHGIGFISLDSENPAESQVLIPARERTEVDWDTVNRLAKESRDFAAYIKAVRQFYQLGEVKPLEWDIPRD